MFVTGACSRVTYAQIVNSPLDAGDVVITEFYQHLFKLNPTTGGKTPLNHGVFDPIDLIAVDASGDVLGLQHDGSLARFSLATLAVTPVTSTLFPFPVDLEIEADGSLLVATLDDVFRVDPASGQTETLVNHEDVNDGFFSPQGLAVGPTGRIYVTEFFEQLWEVNPTTGAASILPTSRELDGVSLIEARSDGVLITREFSTNSLLKIDPDTGAVSTFAPGLPTFTHQMAIEANDDVLLTWTSGVLRFDAATGAQSGLVEDGPFFAPHGIAVAGASALPEYAADFDGDGDVDADDLETWKTAVFQADGAYDGSDFLTWQRELGSTGGATAAAIVPEPAALALALVVVAAVAALASRHTSRTA